MGIRGKTFEPAGGSDVTVDVAVGGAVVGNEVAEGEFIGGVMVCVSVDVDAGSGATDTGADVDVCSGGTDAGVVVEVGSGATDPGTVILHATMIIKKATRAPVASFFFFI